jgi:mono/diheme cytochrome c family protein
MAIANPAPIPFRIIQTEFTRASRQNNHHFLGVLPFPFGPQWTYDQVMKKYFVSQSLVFAIFLGLGGHAAATAQSKVIKEVPVKMIPSLEGKDLFREYCAVCHGVDAKGKGPAAEALKKPATDLTQLSHNNKGKYPALAVQSSIKLGTGPIEHGTGEMPIWGSVFSQTGQQRDLGEMRVMALVKYVEQIQAK